MFSVIIYSSKNSKTSNYRFAKLVAKVDIAVEIDFILTIKSEASKGSPDDSIVSVRLDGESFEDI